MINNACTAKDLSSQTPEQCEQRLQTRRAARHQESPRRTTNRRDKTDGTTRQQEPLDSVSKDYNRFLADLKPSEETTMHGGTQLFWSTQPLYLHWFQNGPLLLTTGCNISASELARITCAETLQSLRHSKGFVE